MAELQEAKWYVIHTYSGYEQMVKDSLEKLIENNNLQDVIKEVLIPMVSTIEEKNGKKKVVQRKMFPSYVIAKLIFSNDLWYMVTNTRGVTGFVGPGGHPLPLTDEEVKRLHLEKVDGSNLNIAVGDYVKVIEGALETFEGTVLQTNDQTMKARVSVSMFGRDTEVELDYSQLEKVDLNEISE